MAVWFSYFLGSPHKDHSRSFVLPSPTERHQSYLRQPHILLSCWPSTDRHSLRNTQYKMARQEHRRSHRAVMISWPDSSSLRRRSYHQLQIPESERQYLHFGGFDGNLLANRLCLLPLQPRIGHALAGVYCRSSSLLHEPGHNF